MSIAINKTVRCPQCGSTIDITIWQSINNVMNPYDFPDIISGKFFEIECGNCGLRTNVNYPILVHDMFHKVMIHYAHPEGAAETEKAVEETRKLYEGKVRIVTDQISLREKVAIFSEGLDDRVVELIKVLMLEKLEDQLADKEVLGVYFVADESQRLEIVYSGGTAILPVSMDFYNDVKNEFLGEEALRGNQEVYVDRAWALGFLGRK